MPYLTRTFIKTSFVYFFLALLVGVGLAGRTVWEFPSFISTLGPVYFHLFLVGWVTQLIFGMVYWMFPKFTREKPRGNVFFAWSVFVLLNVGLLLRVFGEPLHANQPSAGWGWLLAASALLQWLAGIIFVVNTWGRIKFK